MRYFKCFRNPREHNSFYGDGDFTVGEVYEVQGFDLYKDDVPDIHIKDNNGIWYFEESIHFYEVDV